MNSKLLNKTFDACMIIITFIAICLCLFPMMNVASMSLSSNKAVLSNKVWLLPVGWTLQAYKAVFEDKTMTHSLLFTAGLTAACTLISLTLTILAAYPLTKKRLKGRKFFMTMIIITMYFSGGMIPDYLLIRNLGLLDNVLAMVLPGVVSAFNMIILRSFFMSLPESLEESAYLDGASDFTILVRIVLPLSTPVLATLALFYAVGRWNGFQDALMYISNPKLFPLQLKLYQIVYNLTAIEINQMEGAAASADVLAESLKAACVMFATVPILIVYPWLQRYFISGVMLGAIKG
jgi:putative aldouronate transport system permease protein